MPRPEIPSGERTQLVRHGHDWEYIVFVIVVTCIALMVLKELWVSFERNTQTIETSVTPSAVAPSPRSQTLQAR